MRLIRKVKPSLITVSEAKVAAIRDSTSNFSKLVNRLKAMGYNVEYARIFTNDEEAEQLLRIYEDFEKRVLKPLAKKEFTDHDFLSSQGFERHVNELIEATKRYFKSQS